YKKRFLHLSLLVPFALAGCGGSEQASTNDLAPAAAQASTDSVRINNAANVDDARLLRGTADTSAWAHYGGSYDEQRFSPLDKINDTNVSQLGLAWYMDYDTNQNQHGSPLYIDGVLYV